ncbi:MAG: efflux RND transporter periplasmic adaptor subunit [Ruminococcaceae bacterium]|nr:efflux RND transporter periplasmic adaptor subunit [Oscillospiraceae bacterium]
MNKTYKRTAVFLCTALLFSFAGCSKDEPQMMNTTVSVETCAVSRGSLSASSTYIGTISAEGTASVVSLVSGTVEHVAVSMGDTVSAGDLLCSFDDESASLTLQSALASYESAKASLGSAREGYNSAQKGYDSAVANHGGEDMSIIEDQVRTAKENYEATKALFDIGAASRLEVDQALQTYNTAKAGLDAAKNSLSATAANIESARAGVEAAEAGVQAAEVGVASAEYQLSLYRITSPISGTVESVNVISDNFTPSGTVAFVISNADNKTVTFYVTDEVMKNIAVGQAVTVSARNAEYSGTVSEISGIVDPQTGLFRIKALINDAKELPDGLSVSVTTISDNAENSIIVPSDALYFDNGTAYVYTVSDNTARRTDVSVSLYTKEQTAISGGLSDGDIIITSWSEALKNGSPLNIVNQPESSSDTGGEAAQ